MTVLLTDLLPFGSGEKKIITVVLLLLLEMFLESTDAQSNRAHIESHLQKGKELLEKGLLSDALTHYHAAVEADPSNYLTLFKRGTVYLALGKTRSVIQDFSRVLELKPDFTAARAQRGLVHFKCGQYDAAENDFEIVMQEDLENTVASESWQRIHPAKRQWQIVQDLISRNDHAAATGMLTQLLELSPWSVEFLRARAEAHIAQNDILSAISDMRMFNKHTPDSTEGYYRLSALLYKIGHATNALKEIRECLKMDPEHKDCFPFYKKLRVVEKSLTKGEEQRDKGNYAECISSADLVLKKEQEEGMIIFEANRLLCSCYMHDEKYSKALAACKDALSTMRNAHVLCDRAEVYIGLEMYEDAIHDYQSAIEIDEYLSRAKEGLEKAKRLQKQSERRDYYKILGVKRTATKSEITKAYRKAAQKWHPDGYTDDEKKIAEKKFIDIAAAKEVLSDPEKRRKFDNGEDPLDPESVSFRGDNPFTHFHHGSPFQFKFHFN